MKTRRIFENFFIENDVPLDAKTVVTSLQLLPVELPLYQRYLGLWFYNKDDKKFYCFRNSTVTPELLIQDSSVSNIFGITVSDYTQLITTLNLYNTLGKLIYVAGLDVFFKFDGVQWKYHSGTYTFLTNIEYNNFPFSLRYKNAPVSYLNVLMKFDANLDLVNYLIRTNNQNNLTLMESDTGEVDFLNYYVHRNQLYTAFDNNLWKIGSKITVTKNVVINIGKTILTSISISNIGDINIPPYIKAIMWINNNVELNNFNTELKPIELNISYLKNTTNNTWEIYAYSDYVLTGTLEIQF